MRFQLALVSNPIRLPDSTLNRAFNSTMPHSNPFLLAADNSPQLLPLLRSNPSLASSQDAHGYSLVHAAASYNHYDLLRTLVSDLNVNVNIRDEDGETPLFVVETVEAARVLVEELGADTSMKNEEGMTAEEKIGIEGDYPTVAAYLKETRIRGTARSLNGESMHQDLSRQSDSETHHPPPLPPNVTVNVGSMEEGTSGDAGEVDPEFKRRIEELAARDDFQGEEGQQQLRSLIADTVRSMPSEESGRETRRRLE